MKLIIYILIFGLFGCNNTTDYHSDFKSKDSLGSDLKQNTLNTLVTKEKQSDIDNKENEEIQYSKVYFFDSLFSNLELKLKEISSIKYKDFEKKYRTACSLETNGFTKGKGLVYSNFCEEICESYLTDKNAGVTLVLPSSYDEGIIGLLVSPSCNQFIVYSSYDRPEYTEYYENRAEIYGFTITQGKGFKTIKPSFKYFTKDWSINQVTWIDDNTLALRLYNGENNGNRERLKYSYFQTDLKTK